MAIFWSGVTRVSLTALVAPTRSHAVPRERARSTTPRPPMNATPNATHSQTSVPWPATAAQAAGREDDQHRESGPGQVAPVAGPDQHAVEDEDDPGDRLGEGGHQQHRHQQVQHDGVGGEQRAEDRARRGQQRVR